MQRWRVALVQSCQPFHYGNKWGRTHRTFFLVFMSKVVNFWHQKRLEAMKYFHKKLQFRCLSRFSIRLWSLSLPFIDLQTSVILPPWLKFWIVSRALGFYIFLSHRNMKGACCSNKICSLLNRLNHFAW